MAHKWVFISVLIIGILFTTTGVLLGVVTDTKQHVVAVWEAACIGELAKGKDVRVEAPVDLEGKPDLKHGLLFGVIVNLKPGCEHLEVRK